MSNELENLRKLYVKTKKIKIPEHPEDGEKQIELEFQELGIDELVGIEFEKNSSLNDILPGLKLLIARALKVDEDIVSKFSLKNILELSQKIINFDNNKNNKLKLISNKLNNLNKNE